MVNLNYCGLDLALTLLDVTTKLVSFNFDSTHYTCQPAMPFHASTAGGRSVSTPIALLIGMIDLCLTMAHPAHSLDSFETVPQFPDVVIVEELKELVKWGADRKSRRGDKKRPDPYSFPQKDDKKFPHV